MNLIVQNLSRPARVAVFHRRLKERGSLVSFITCSSHLQRADDVVAVLLPVLQKSFEGFETS